MNGTLTQAAMPSHERYRAAMVEIKWRLRAIDRVLGAKKPRTLTAEFDNEFMWLQVRKIVELVAFGGMTADEARYAALRAEAKDNPNYRRDWKVGQILKRLAEITPHYLADQWHLYSSALQRQGLVPTRRDDEVANWCSTMNFIDSAR